MRNEKIGFIGLGNVGEKLSKNLLNKKNKLYLFDKDKKKYLKFKNFNTYKCNNLKDIALNCSVIITCLPSPQSINSVIKSLLPYLNKTHLWIDMSTTDQNEMIRLSKILKKRGVNILEAPITGGEHRATSGNISILTGGKRTNFNRAFPILAKLGHKILYCGEIGNASILKIITNYLASLHLVGIGEALALARKQNIDLGLTYNAIKISSEIALLMKQKQKYFSWNYDVGFTMDLVNKDINIFNKLAKQKKIPVDLAKLLNKKLKME